jgi:hypothetical protein
VTASGGYIALDMEPDLHARVTTLKQLTWDYVIENPRLATHRRVFRGSSRVSSTPIYSARDSVSRPCVLVPSSGFESA